MNQLRRLKIPRAGIGPLNAHAPALGLREEKSNSAGLCSLLWHGGLKGTGLWQHLTSASSSATAKETPVLPKGTSPRGYCTLV